MKHTFAFLQSRILRNLGLVVAVCWSHAESLGATGAGLEASIREIRTGTLVIEAAAKYKEVFLDNFNAAVTENALNNEMLHGNYYEPGRWRITTAFVSPTRQWRAS